MEPGDADPAHGRRKKRDKGENEREHSKQVDIRSTVLQREDLPPFDTAEVDPLRVFVRRVCPRLKVVLTTSGEEPEELLQQAVLTLSTRRRELDSQDTWSAGTLHLRSMLYWRKRQRGVCEAVDRALLEMVGDSEAPRALKQAVKEHLERWIRGLPPRCRNRLRVRYGLASDSDQLSLKLESRRARRRKITSRCLQAMALAILQEGARELGRER